AALQKKAVATEKSCPPQRPEQSTLADFTLAPRYIDVSDCRCTPEGARMSTTVSVLGGVGLFLLGMSVMTAGLKGLAGSGLRTILSKAAATPLSGAFWGAIVTLIVQSSSATTMTTIG